MFNLEDLQYLPPDNTQMKNNLSTAKAIEEFEKTITPDLPSSMFQKILEHADAIPDTTAIHFFLQTKDFKNPTSISYKMLAAELTKTANLFRKFGLEKEDVVSFILPNSPETVFTFFGGEVAGIANPINVLLEPDQMAEIMNAAQTKILVTLAPFPKTDIWDKVEQIIDQIPTLETIFTVDLANYLNFPQKQLVKLFRKKTPSNPKIKILDFVKEKNKMTGDRLTFERHILHDDIASYFHTGGTTGTPKLAIHTHKNEMYNAWAISELLKGNEDPINIFCGLPWFHVNGVTVTGIAPFMVGATMILGTPAGYRGEGLLSHFWKIIEHYKITHFSCVPTVLQYLLNIPVGTTDISSMKFAVCGASSLSPKLYNDFQHHAKFKIIEGYGMTEGNCVSSVNPVDGEKKIGSVGLPLPFHFMKIVKLDSESNYLEDAKTNEIGSIIINGGNVFPGYKEERHNLGIWVDIDGKKWFNTGDLGKKDEDGYIFISGRKKELIIRGGHNIDPSAIEEPLMQHPAVTSVAAIGRPDKTLGEMPVAYVTTRQEVSEEALIEFAKAHIKERAAVPKFIYIEKELPLTAVGKIFKPELINRQILDVINQELTTLSQQFSYHCKIATTSKTGTVAHISILKESGCTLDEAKKLIEEKLGNYTFKYEVRNE